MKLNFNTSDFGICQRYSRRNLYGKNCNKNVAWNLMETFFLQEIKEHISHHSWKYSVIWSLMWPLAEKLSEIKMDEFYYLRYLSGEKEKWSSEMVWSGWINRRGNITKKMCYAGYHEKEGKGRDLCVSGKRIWNPFQEMRFGNWTMKNITLETEDGQTITGWWQEEHFVPL